MLSKKETAMACFFKHSFILIILIAVAFSSYAISSNNSMDLNNKTLIQIFYKKQKPSLEAYNKIKSFLEPFAGDCKIQYLLISEPDNKKLMKDLGFYPDHFPIGIAINGKTSANIDGDIITFANFPVFMHHIGRHPGNWTLNHLKKALKNPTLLKPDNPVIKNTPRGK